MMKYRIPRDRPLLIVSDVDGTLLDEQHRLPMPSDEMRRFIATRLGRGVRRSVFAFASSRTLLELVELQQLLALSGPLIAEDGGVLAIDGDDASLHGVDITVRRVQDRPFSLVHVGVPASQLRARLEDAAPDDQHFVLAGMPAPQLAQLGFQNADAVHHAITSREASVLLDLDGISDEERERYVQAAARAGVTVKRGGRWCTAVSGADKGRALVLLREALTHRHGVAPFVIAIGNEENDVALLSEADLPLVIRNPGRGHHPALAAVPGAVLLDAHGTDGFLEMFEIISQAEAVTS